MSNVKTRLDKAATQAHDFERAQVIKTLEAAAADELPPCDDGAALSDAEAGAVIENLRRYCAEFGVIITANVETKTLYFEV